MGIVFRGVTEALKNYKDASLPLSLKVAIPVALGAAAVLGGQGAGLAAFGGAIGLPVILVCGSHFDNRCVPEDPGLAYLHRSHTGDDRTR